MNALKHNLILNTDALRSAKVDGRGGKESELLALFPTLRRESRPLYDFVDDVDGVKYELKKQKNVQWFDLSKYHNLSDDEREIRLLVVLLDKKKEIDIVSIVQLGSFIDKMRDINHDWSEVMLKAANDFKKLLMTTQIKTPVNLRKMVAKYPEIFDTIYQSMH